MAEISKWTKKLICLLLALGLSALCLCGCQKEQKEPGSLEKNSGKKVRIGISFDSFVIERWLRDRDVFVSTAENLGAEVNVQNANGDVEQQISQIRYFIKNKEDVIVIVANDANALKDVVKEAKNAGIRVISYDRLLVDCGSDLYISFDNVRVGELMGEALAEALPQGGKVFTIYGSQNDNNVQLVQEGLLSVLEKEGISVTFETYCDNWLAELAFDAVNEGLAKEPDVQGIMCGNDDLAGQAIRALSENFLAGEVAVVAQDADLSACQRIVEGTQTMTVYKPVDELAAKAATLAVALGKGDDITGMSVPVRVRETIFDGSEEIPYFRISPIAVTRDNIDEVIIDSGFHLRDDVYLNVKS